jgi:hypothetical protein
MELQNVDSHNPLDRDDVEIAANVYTRVDVISSIEGFYELREEWNYINDHSAKGTVFLSWEWLYTWWQTYCDDGDRQLYILICTNIHKQVFGIAPFQIINNAKRYFPCSHQIVQLGTAETDGVFVFGEYMDLLIRTGHETAVIHSFTDFLIKHSFSWDGLKFHELLKDSHLSRLFTEHTSSVNSNGNKKEKHRIIKTEKAQGFRTFIDLPTSYKEYLMSLRKKMRNNITRNFSRIENEQTFTFKTIKNVSEVEHAISVLADLNRSRRGSLKKKSSFESARFELFHKRVAKLLLPQNKVSLRVLSFSDKPVAALYSFVDGDTIHPYQSGFDTQNGLRYSLLTTMLTEEIAKSISNPALSCFNFMYSDEEATYKKRYSGTTETMYTLSFDKPGLKYTVYCFIHGPLKTKLKKLLKK